MDDETRTEIEALKEQLRQAERIVALEGKLSALEKRVEPSVALTTQLGQYKTILAFVGITGAVLSLWLWNRTQLLQQQASTASKTLENLKTELKGGRVALDLATSKGVATIEAEGGKVRQSLAADVLKEGVVQTASGTLRLAAGEASPVWAQLEGGQVSTQIDISSVGFRSKAQFFAQVDCPDEVPLGYVGTSTFLSSQTLVVYIVGVQAGRMNQKDCFVQWVGIGR